jgi:3-phosphoshikimate 1-carboxyvinyltransferase
MQQFDNRKIVIVGLGLIGVDCEIVAVGRNTTVLEQAINDGSITGFTTDLQTACAGADLIVIAVPVLTIEAVLRELAPVLAPHTVVTDVASVKQAVVSAAERVFGKIPATLVPGHPIAGSERSGYKAARADLFAGRKVILTPLADTAPEALQLVTALWHLCAADVLEMSVEHHDEVLAATSHLPHLLAFALVDTLSQQGESEEIFRYAAGGFRDFTRIASSDPVMWRDIFVTNGAATVRILDAYMADLQRLRTALLNKDADVLLRTFKRARQSREAFLALNKAVARKADDGDDAKPG